MEILNFFNRGVNLSIGSNINAISPLKSLKVEVQEEYICLGALSGFSPTYVIVAKLLLLTGPSESPVLPWDLPAQARSSPTPAWPLTHH